MDDPAHALTPNPTPVGWTETPSDAKLAVARSWARGATALDLGCGRGWYARALADDGYRVTAIDQQPRFADARVDIRAMRIEPPLPFADNAFDTVLMFDILEHLEDEAAILREVARLTRRRLLLSAPNADDGFLPRYALTYLHRVDRTHVREYTLAALPALLARYGFRTLSVRLEGRPHIPLVFSEFVRGPRAVKSAARYLITAFYKLGLLHNPHIAGDIFWVGEPAR